MQKRIKKDLPKYNETLRKRLKEWQAESGEHFVYKGEAYAETMERQESEWAAYKDEVRICVSRRTSPEHVQRSDKTRSLRSSWLLPGF